MGRTECAPFLFGRWAGRLRPGTFFCLGRQQNFLQAKNIFLPSGLCLLRAEENFRHAQ
jgi:hypothetical protein